MEAEDKNIGSQKDGNHSGEGSPVREQGKIHPQNGDKANKDEEKEAGKSDKKEGEVLETVPLERIQEYLEGKYQFRRNIVTSRIEFRKLELGDYAPINDNIINSLWRELTIARRPCSIATLNSLLRSDFSPAFDPFKAYLEGLPEWDGENDYIEALAKTVATSNPELFMKCLKKWLVALVASLEEEQVVNQTAIVFSGGQGIGKTTWLNNLVPEVLRQYYFSGTINPNNKDTLIHLSECMIINLDELENLNRSEIGALKEVITKGVIRLRRPYGMENESFIRRASFVGSVNASQFLNDPTGSRRFLCFEAFSFERQGKPDVDLVYSQAFSLYKDKFQYWFDPEEIAEVESNNQQYQVISLEEEFLWKSFEPCSCDHQNCLVLTATEIGSILQEEYKVRIDQGMINRIGKVLHRHEVIQVKKKGMKKYCLKRVGLGVETGNNSLRVAS